MLLTSKKWHVLETFDKEDTNALVDILLKHRNIITPEDRENFVIDGDGVWHDPFLFNDMHKAVDIIVDAISDHKRILIYGDYDCDGVTATTILVRYLRSHNCDVEYIVPHRAEHGYGLTSNILEKVLKHKPQLVITVDCGITNSDTIALLKEKGISVIITDHHNVKEDIPNADAVICAKRADNKYPFIDLCGAGVALKVVEALGRDGRYKVTSSVWRQSIELAGIATIADLVSVVDENRTIIKKAFISMKNPINPGVRIMNSMLLDSNKRLDETFISFNFVPRINAAGRLYDSSDALTLFLENDEAVVRGAAEALGRQNDERKEIEARVFEQAVRQVEDTSRPEAWLLTNTCGPIVVYSPKWHQGVLGIVAGKLSQYYRRPAIVFTDDSINSENVKGSGRSFGEFDLYDSLVELSDYCINYGGHKKAAGLVVSKAGFKDFMYALEENARKLKERTPEHPDTEEESSDDENILEINAQIPFEQVSFSAYEQISIMRPFGIGNRKPVFSTRNLIISEIVGMSDGAHMRLELIDGTRDSNGNAKNNNLRLSAVGFGMGQYLSLLKVGDRVDIAYTMNEYTYRGNTTLSLYLEDIIPVSDGSFMWSKSDTAEQLYCSGMPIDQISKLARCTVKEGFIPTQSDYAACYRVLDNRCRDGISTADVVLLARMVNMNASSEMTPFKVRRCLDVFAEAGLIKMGIIDSNRVCFSFLHSSGKVKLSETKTYMGLLKYE